MGIIEDMEADAAAIGADIDAATEKVLATDIEHADPDELEALAPEIAAVVKENALVAKVWAYAKRLATEKLL